MSDDLFISYSRGDNGHTRVTALVRRIEADFRAFAGRPLRSLVDVSAITALRPAGRLRSRYDRFGLAIRVALFLVVCATSVGVAEPAPAFAVRSCAVVGRHLRGVVRSRVIKSHGDVVLYRVLGATSDSISACDRATKRFVLIGHDESRQDAGGEYPPERTVTELHLAGQWVIALTATGEGAASVCSKYGGDPCPSVHVSLVVANVARGVTGTASNAAETESELLRPLVSSAGTVAWVQSSVATTSSSRTLFGCEARIVRRGVICRPREIVTSDLKVSSLTLSGRKVSWSDDTGAHTAFVPP